MGRSNQIGELLEVCIRVRSSMGLWVRWKKTSRKGGGGGGGDWGIWLWGSVARDTKGRVGRRVVVELVSKGMELRRPSGLGATNTILPAGENRSQRVNCGI